MCSFSAANNLLTGTIPETIGNLKHLKEINLREYNDISYLFMDNTF